jgi:UDP-glucose 4-epimerase
MLARKLSSLVTGGAGFIGSHLCEALVNRGVHVIVVDDLSSGDIGNIERIATQIDLLQFDIRSSAFHRLVRTQQFDVIFHLAGNSYVPPSVKEPERDFSLNLHATFQLLETLRCQAPQTALIVASSAAVYGDPQAIPVFETALTDPVSPYGVSKLAMERYVAVYSRLYGLKAASLRFFSVYGPRQRKQLVYDFFQKLSRNPEELEILGDGTQVRDLVYVTDVTQALLLVHDRGSMCGEVYNVGTGVGQSTREIGEAVVRAAGLTPKVRFTGAIRPGDADKWIAGLGGLTKLGYVPQVMLDEGIQQTWEWYMTLGAGIVT